jgi:hypothetical protein
LLLQQRRLVAEASMKNDPKPMTRPALLRTELGTQSALLDSLAPLHGPPLGGFVLPLSGPDAGPAELLTYEFHDFAKSRARRRLVVIDPSTGAVLRRLTAR